ncbi:MAG: polysaccharide pyruvyl transferase family protein [Clostridia bacterium]|nr:polysaccharide pyruvyl transferase family protein [Clostridia bacterium]
MTRVGIMTFLHNENCGSSLQAWALQETLRNLGYEPYGLDWRPDRKEQVRNLLASGNSPAVVLDSMRRRKARGERNTAGFERFNREKLSLSPACRDRAALRREAGSCRLLLCGSDQVWSPEWLNSAYFLDFAEGQPRIAYACSLGVSAQPGARKGRKIARLVRPFAAVSVREEEGRAVLERLLPDKTVDVMPDPVMLVPGERWHEMCGSPETRRTLVCYFLRDQESAWQAAEELAAREKLTLLPLAVTNEGRRRSGALCNPDPLQWLRTMASAGRVITDSFHGAAMAALLGKPLTVVRRWRDGDPASKNSRIDQLMRLAGWTEDSACLPSARVEERLSEQRMKGTAWLSAALEQALKSIGQR